MLLAFCMTYSLSLHVYSLFKAKLPALPTPDECGCGQFSRNSFLKKVGDMSLYCHDKNDRYLIIVKNRHVSLIGKMPPTAVEK